MAIDPAQRGRHGWAYAELSAADFTQRRGQVVREQTERETIKHPCKILPLRPGVAVIFTFHEKNVTY